MKDQPGIRLAAEFDIGVKRARIPGEIFVGTKLSRIYKNGNDDEITFAACLVDQAGMAGMQGAHRRNKPDPHSLRPGRLDGLTDL